MTNLIPYNYSISVGDLLINLDNIDNVYYIPNFRDSGPTIVSVITEVPDDIDFDENVLKCFETLGIHGLGSSLVTDSSQLPESAQALTAMDRNFEIKWQLFGVNDQMHSKEQDSSKKTV